MSSQCIFRSFHWRILHHPGDSQRSENSCGNPVALPIRTMRAFCWDPACTSIHIQSPVPQRFPIDIIGVCIWQYGDLHLTGHIELLASTFKFHELANIAIEDRDREVVRYEVDLERFSSDLPARSQNSWFAEYAIRAEEGSVQIKLI